MNIKVPCFLVVLLYSNLTQAQNDTSILDLGYNSAKNNFIQHITIPAKELQKLPFASLEEALNIYFCGAYTIPQNIAYVIDGNISSAINHLSVYDIESVTLIQNAQFLLNGALPAQQLIIIKTKSQTYSQKQEGTERKIKLNAAISGYLTKRRDPQTEKFYEQDKPGFYQQYYLGAHAGSRQTNFGASVNFLRTAIIYDTAHTQKGKPNALDIYRANAWFNTSFGRSTLSLRVSAAPGDSSTNQENHDPRLFLLRNQIKTRENDLIINPAARLFTKLSDKWTNDLSFSYTYIKLARERNTTNYTYLFSPAVTLTSLSVIGDTTKENNLLFRDRLGFETTVDNWTFNPSVNVLLIHKKTSRHNTNKFYSGSSISYSDTYFEIKNNDIAVSPAISVAYKTLFSVETGVQYNRSKKAFGSTNASNFFPFASACFDVIKAFNSQNHNSIKLFASYARGNSWKERMYQNNVKYGLVSGNPIISPDIKEDPATSTTLGVSIGPANDKFNFSYSFEKTNYKELIVFNLPLSGGGGTILRDGKSEISSHHFTVSFNSKNYTSHINVYNRKYSMRFNSGNEANLIAKGWTGGWVNKVTFNKIVAGINAMYFFDHDIKSFLLQHFYAGYQLRANAEVYLSARNAFLNKKLTIPGSEIAYFGAGVNVNF